jgi:biotin transport system substrate-specific component
MPNTLAFQVFRLPSPTLRSTAFFDGALILIGSLLIALMAQISVPVPFTPVPLTGQSFAVLLVGASLGARRGALAVLAYLAEGLVGLPVFAPGGAWGVARLLGPTGGYLVGFVAAAACVGWFAERSWDRQFAKAWLAFFCAHSLIFLFGVAWFSGFVGLRDAIGTGYLPFLPGELLKTALAAAMTSTLWGQVGKRSR